MDTPFGFGAHPSAHDYRDIKDYHVALAVPSPVSHTDDLSMIPVSMQNKIGICTSNLCDKVEKLYFERTGIYLRLSRRFLYTVTKRMIDGNTSEGSSCRSALKAAYKYGIAPEIMVPTDTTVTHDQFISDYTFTPEIWAEALKYRIGGYISVGTDKASIAAAISQYGTLYGRVECGATWWTPSWLGKDILPLKYPEPVVSGHAVNYFGYDLNDPKGRVDFRNSWSQAWGVVGNGFMCIDDYPPTELWAVTLEPMAIDLPAQPTYVFSRDMAYGQTSEDVRQLQIYLKYKGYFDYPTITPYYGSVTQDAVYRFQLDHVYLSWWEKVFLKGSKCGVKTRAVINSLK